MASSRSSFAFVWVWVVSMLVFVPCSWATERGIAESVGGKNQALLVGVSHGLPGIDLDVDNVEKMATHGSYKFATSFLEEAAGTSTRVGQELTRLAEKSDKDGTLFFYFSGHGSSGSLYMQDGSMKIGTIRTAMEKGRAALGPLARLVMMFDSCYSGSLLDPVRLLPLNQLYEPRLASAIFADEVVREMTPVSRNDEEAVTYWKKLFVFASSRADETSLAGDDGSVFTVALKKAFDEVIVDNDTLDSWVKKTQTYTVGHHPVARFVPATLASEKMTP